MSRNDLVLGQPQTWAIQPPSGSHNSNCCRQRHGALKKNGGLMLDRDIRRAQQGSRRYITLVEPRRMKLHIGVWSGTFKHICQTIAVALKLWKPDFGRCQIRIEAPKAWYFQPLCNLYQDSAILVHFTLKVFQGCNLSATCESFVFFFHPRCRRTSLVRDALFSSIAVCRGARASPLRGAARLSWILLICQQYGHGQGNVLILVLDTFGVWSLGVGSNIAMVLRSQKDDPCNLQSRKSQGHWCDCFRSTFQCLLLRHVQAATKHHHGQRKFSLLTSDLRANCSR